MHPLSGYEVANKKFVVLFKLDATSNFGKINDQKLRNQYFLLLCLTSIVFIFSS